MPTLILTPRFTDDSQALWRAAIRAGWAVERLPSWRVPPELRSAVEPVLYLEGLFGPTFAAEFGLRLPEPPEDWLPRQPYDYRRREVTLTNLGKARGLTEPAFVKPPNTKGFLARVYPPFELPRDYDDQTPVLVAEPVEWEREYRCFVLDRSLRTLSIYLRDGVLQRDCQWAQSEAEAEEARAFVVQVLTDPRVDLPRATVVDVGVIRGRGWAVVEQNAAWASGIYGCDPDEVLQVLRHAALPA